MPSKGKSAKHKSKRSKEVNDTDEADAEAEEEEREEQEEDEEGDPEENERAKGPAKRERPHTGRLKKSYKRKRTPSSKKVSAAEAESYQADLGKKLINLVTEHADVQKLKEIAASLPVRHFNDKQTLLQSYKQQFDTWHWQLREGFSILLYGFGSKRALLEQFGREALTDGGVLVASGHLPSVTAKKLLQALVLKATGRGTSGKGPAELLAALAALAPERRMYVLIHNIDGPGLRSLQDQALLSEVAACPSVHLAASIDHCNAPLLWDRPTAARFNWLWADTTTYAPYAAEALDIPPILSGVMQASTRKSASAVLRSMVPTSRAVFNVVAEYQEEDPGTEGLSFPHLYRLCRERFLVSSEGALRTHLVEFKDHELLKTRVSSEGQEVVYIPLELEALQKVLQELQELD